MAVAVYKVAGGVAAGWAGGQDVELLVGREDGSAGWDRVVNIATHDSKRGSSQCGQSRVTRPDHWRREQGEDDEGKEAPTKDEGRNDENRARL